MKIAVVASKEKQDIVLSKKGRAMLERLGEVVYNDGEANEENVKKVIKDADVAISSWGSIPFTAKNIAFSGVFSIITLAEVSFIPPIYPE